MSENTMVIIGAIISIWVSFLIWMVYPDVGEGFIFAMLATWVVIFFFLDDLHIEEFENDQDR